MVDNFISIIERYFGFLSLEGAIFQSYGSYIYEYLVYITACVASIVIFLIPFVICYKALFGRW